MAKNNTRGEIRLSPPRHVLLSAAQYDEAVSLLAELLLEVAAKRRGVRSGGVFGSVSGGAIDSVNRLDETSRNGREAA